MAKALSLLGRMRLWAQFRRVLHNMRTVRAPCWSCLVWCWSGCTESRG